MAFPYYYCECVRMSGPVRTYRHTYIRRGPQGGGCVYGHVEEGKTHNGKWRVSIPGREGIINRVNSVWKSRVKDVGKKGGWDAH